tara:strand:- start:43495 stop:44172 length:678 start_codon:yes stop_codon:yes gene_type:complete
MLIHKKYFIYVTISLLVFSCGAQKSKKNHKNAFLESKFKTDFIFIEAEQTLSNLQKWLVVKKDDKNYVNGASGEMYLEFMGNKAITGKPNSPLEYKFTAPKSGNFKLMLMTSKRLEGEKSDWCNDAFIKLSGNFETASKLTTAALKKDIKILQDGNDETAELKWHWASTAEKDRHVYTDFVYQLKKGEKYILTLSGRSMRFSVDYLVLYDSNKFSFNEAKKLFKK